MNIKLTTPLPAEISYGANGCYFIGNGFEGKLRVPVFDEEMMQIQKIRTNRLQF